MIDGDTVSNVPENSNAHEKARNINDVQNLQLRRTPPLVLETYNGL